MSEGDRSVSVEESYMLLITFDRFLSTVNWGSVCVVSAKDAIQASPRMVMMMMGVKKMVIPVTPMTCTVMS